jgi:hypothetical protein
LRVVLDVPTTKLRSSDTLHNGFGFCIETWINHVSMWFLASPNTPIVPLLVVIFYYFTRNEISKKWKKGFKVYWQL